MPSIDDSIRKIDNVICRHLDNIENSSRGAISQDILEQLMKFVNHVMLKFYANGSDIPINNENIAKAAEYAQINSQLSTLYKFRNFLQVVTTQFTLDEDGSERLMLKYYQYLLEAKILLSRYYGIRVLHNLAKFPLHLDDTLQEYYGKIAEKLEQHPAKFNGAGNGKYYIQKIKPLFVNRRIYYEVSRRKRRSCPSVIQPTCWGCWISLKTESNSPCDVFDSVSLMPRLLCHYSLYFLKFSACSKIC